MDRIPPKNGLKPGFQTYNGVLALDKRTNRYS